VNEDSGSNSLDVLVNDTYLPDPPETLTITGKTDPSHGSVAIAGGGTAITYTPAPGYYGLDSFTYTIGDGHGGTDAATVHVTVSVVTPVVGDATLDGKVNITDLGALASNWQATGAKWGQGDFTGEGNVNITDLGALASNWQFGATITAVPEPASAALVALGALVMIRRRTRRQKPLSLWERSAHRAG